MDIMDDASCRSSCSDEDVCIGYNLFTKKPACVLWGPALPEPPLGWQLNGAASAFDGTITQGNGKAIHGTCMKKSPSA